MNLSTTSPAVAGGGGGASRRIARTALVAGFVTGGLAVGAQAANAAAYVQVKHRTLTIAGTARSDKLALRLRAGHPQTLQVDVGDDGTPDFQVRRRRFDRITVNAGSGNDLV